MDKPFDVIVVGELNADLVLTGDVTPAFGQVEKLIDDATLTIGSSSAIFACGAARLGLRVAFIGKVGADEFGRYMLRELNGRGIDTSQAVVDSALKTGLTVILSRGNDRAILTFLGSIAALRYSDINPDFLAQGRHLHIGSYYLLDQLRPGILALFDAAQAKGLTLSIDTNYDPSEQWEGGIRDVLERVNIFLPNNTELCAIAGVNDLEAALHALPTQIIAVKQGAKGALARSGKTIVRAASIPVDVVDTTGAGDSFDAGFIYGFLKGWNTEQSLRLACVCGALSTRAAGGTSAQPTLDEAQRWL